MTAIKTITSVLSKMEAVLQVKNLTGYFSLIHFQFILENGRRRGELDINGMVRSEAERFCIADIKERGKMEEQN